jgi:sugar lactone lactonase YvrE
MFVVAWSVFLTPIAAAEPQIETILGTGRGESNAVTDPRHTNVGFPFGVEIGPDGALYVCEVTNHRVWRLDRATQQLAIVAGNGTKGYSGDGGPATEAQLNEPYEVRFSADGTMYFVEMQNHIVRKVDPRTGRIATVAGNGRAGFHGDGGPADAARLQQPHSIALDGRGGLYIADIGNHRIRRVDLASGRIETFAGTGERRLPQAGQHVSGTPVLGPRALFVTEGTLWIALREGHSVWRISLDHPTWEPVAGTGQQGYSGDDGPATAATFNGPKGIAVDRSGNLYVVDTENEVVRRVDAATGTITTVAGAGPQRRGYSGDGRPARSASLNRPHGICIDGEGRLVIGDTENHRVRQVSFAQ